VTQVTGPKERSKRHRSGKEAVDVVTLRGTWMRGGTSKCWLFNAVDVGPFAQRADDLDGLLVAAFGSGDALQLDGVGGGSSTTSKAAIVRRSTNPDIDIDYLFAQVAIGHREVEWGSNCGNCATAIGLYALQAGLVAVDPVCTTIRMRNQNTGAMLAAQIATPNGLIPTHGNARVPGTTALGVPVSLIFSGVAPTVAALLPTGKAVDTVTAGGRQYRGTLVTAGAPAALFGADQLGLTGADGNDAVAERLPLLVELRRQSALAMGLSKPDDLVAHAIPKVGVVGIPVDYRSASGQQISAGDYDVSVRMVSMLAPHPAIGLTSAVAIAAAATVASSVVADIAGARPAVSRRLRLGTPAGVVSTDITLSDRGLPDTVTLHRAARRIATAELFIADPASVLAGSTP
jgi:2-methylaconitate cis-trans-isomerase PrpF